MKTALVTGSTDGIGRLVAGRLGAEGVHVLVHGRDAERAAAVKQAIEAKGGRATVLIADLSRFAGAQALADGVLKAADRLDIFVSNAGIGFGPAERQMSPDGQELRFAVNYLAGYILAERLKALIVKSAPARMVFVSSIGQYPVAFDDVTLERGYDGSRAYRHSKLAQILQAFALADELKDQGVTVNALHPSTLMNTTMVTQMGIAPMSSVETGAEALWRLAASPELEGVTGRYFDVFTDAKANDQAYDAHARAKLLALSREITRV